RGEDLDGISPDPEGALLEGYVVPSVLNADQLGQDGVPPAALAAGHFHHELAVLDRVAQAVDGAHRGDDDNILPFHEARRGPEPEALDVLVDRGVLLDVHIGGRNVCLRLVIVVVRHEVLDRVPGQELPELPIQLGGERLVVREDQRGLAVVGDDVRQGHRLAGTGDAEQRLVPVSPDEAAGELGNGPGLVPGRLEWGDDVESGARHPRNIAASGLLREWEFCLRGPGPHRLVSQRGHLPEARHRMTDPLAVLQAALADRYVVERRIGEGGMALVFLADDRRHHRAVAIKVLRPEVAAAIGPDRFLREIRFAAELNHPHIVPLFDSGIVPAGEQHSALPYYVMPWLPGESLRDRLAREGALPIEEALGIARQAAAALAYAHRHRIVHRDIKPANILLSDGEAVVADFGTARAVDQAGESD